MDNLLHQMAYVGAIAVLVLVCIGIACIAFAERGPTVEDDQFTPEAPVLPPAFLPAEDRRPTPDRLRAAPLADWERASNREYLEGMRAVEDMKRKTGDYEA